MKLLTEEFQNKTGDVITLSVIAKTSTSIRLKLHSSLSKPIFDKIIAFREELWMKLDGEV